MLNKNQINIFVDIISKKFKSKKIFLFGSNAYGKPQAESDIDICIVMYIGNKRKIELTREIRKEIYTFLNAPIDILIYDIDEFNERSLQPTTLENKILIMGFCYMDNKQIASEWFVIAEKDILSAKYLQNMHPIPSQ